MTEKNFKTTKNPMCFYRLEDGSRVLIPRGPIDGAGIPIPGPVTRPDGKVLQVELLPDIVTEVMPVVDDPQQDEALKPNRMDVINAFDALFARLNHTPV